MYLNLLGLKCDCHVTLISRVIVQVLICRIGQGLPIDRLFERNKRMKRSGTEAVRTQNPAPQSQNG